MKRFLSSTVLLLALVGMAHGATRQRVDIGAGWKFRLTNTDASPKDFNDAAWPMVNIPHTWNASDGTDGGANYFKGIGWYRRVIPWRSSFAGKRLYVEFLGVNKVAQVFVNGKSVGVHKGGYTAFRFDITDFVTSGKSFQLAVKVSNATGTEVIPLMGDFTMYGGIYRSAAIIAASPVHVDLDDNGSSGLYLTTSNVSSASATLEVKATIVNSADEARLVNIYAELAYPNQFDKIDLLNKPPFNPSAMAPGGAPIQEMQGIEVEIPAGGNYTFRRTITVANPKLWNGRKFPFRYKVKLSVREGSSEVDEVSDYVGFRTFSATKAGGFFLNGASYPLRGVSRHQDRAGKGAALSMADHDEDFALIYNLGANAVRLAHYPHAPYFYDLCDRYGIVVWAEIPMVDKWGKESIDKQQLVELIRQQYNRPSIAVWGLQNEVSTGSYDAKMSKYIPMLNNLAHAEDPSRLTTQAQAGIERFNWTTDLFAKNQYPGWYQNGTLGEYIDNLQARAGSAIVGISEFGAGGNPAQHESYEGTPNRSVATTSQWHPEEYQAALHEQCVQDLAARPNLWCAFVWNMFDFGSDARNEGGQPGINDKGLVTFDRKINKDSYYVYQAAWSEWPMVHIAGRRFNPRYVDTIDMRVYSNCSEVELYVNGEYYGVQQLSDVTSGVFTWDNVLLPNKGEGEQGRNQVVAVATHYGRKFCDTVVWYRALSPRTDLASSVLPIDNGNQEIVLDFNTTTYRAEDLSKLITLPDGAKMQLQLPNGQLYTTGPIFIGLRLKVTAEDGKTVVVYRFIRHHLALGKAIIANESAEGNMAELALDGNSETYWKSTSPASESMPVWLLVDLGKVYFLNRINVDWYNSTADPRAYSYYVYTSIDDTSERAVPITRVPNRQPDECSDTLENVAARILEVNITDSYGLNSGRTGYKPAINEIEVYGWTITSRKYDIDYTYRYISVPASDEQLSCAEFLSNLSFENVKKYEMEHDVQFVTGEEKLIVTPNDGKPIAFDIYIDNDVEPMKDVWFYITFNGSNVVLEDKGNGRKLQTANLVPGKPAQLWKKFGFENSYVFESQLGNKIYCEDNLYYTGINRSSGFQILFSEARNAEQLRYVEGSVLAPWGGQGKDRDLTNVPTSNSAGLLRMVDFIDTIPPSTPQNLILNDVTEHSVIILWDEATDNIAVTGYNVYLNGIMITHQATTSCLISNLNADQICLIQVEACDEAGNCSGRSQTLTVTTTAEQKGGEQ